MQFIMELKIEYLEDAEAVMCFVNENEIPRENIIAINTSNDTEEGIYKNKVVLYYFAS